MCGAWGSLSLLTTAVYFLDKSSEWQEDRPNHGKCRNRNMPISRLNGSPHSKEIAHMGTLLEQYRIADFLEWHSKKALVLNPDFQRSRVWTPAARIFLIDTILRQLPIPKIYIRTRVDLTTKGTVREVVDGQQRLRAIIDFANDKIVLSRRAAEFQGLTYSSLPDDLKETFLSYPIAVGQLLNASNEDVLEVFARLNSYSVPLNAPEKRHAKYSGEFKWAVRAAAQRWAVLWDQYEVISVRERVRMMDDSLIAEMLGVLLEGVRDGGQKRIDRLYETHDKTFEPDAGVVAALDSQLQWIVQNLAEPLKGTAAMSGPHFLLLYAAVSHVRHGIPPGELDPGLLHKRGDELTDTKAVIANCSTLANIIESPESVKGFEKFWSASKASTQRISSRRDRFPVFLKALRPEQIETE